MDDPLEYTYDGIEREINLLEIHLKEAPMGDKAFCQDCIDKHIQTIRGFALEGAGFTKNQNEINNFLETEKKLRNIKGKDYQKEGVKFAQEVRNIRKKLSVINSDFSKKILNQDTKDLNNPSTFDNQLNKKPKQKMIEFKELGMVNVGQFAAEGLKYLVETQLPTAEPWASLGGGVGLQVLPMVARLPDWLNKLLVVSGSNLLAYGVVKLVKGVAPVAIVRAGAARAVVGQGQGAVGKFTRQPNARVFGGRVTATNIPTQYARAGIEAGAQQFEAPEHADLIRVD